MAKTKGNLPLPTGKKKPPARSRCCSCCCSCAELCHYGVSLPIGIFMMIMLGIFLAGFTPSAPFDKFFTMVSRGNVGAILNGKCSIYNISHPSGTWKVFYGVEFVPLYEEVSYRIPNALWDSCDPYRYDCLDMAYRAVLENPATFPCAMCAQCEKRKIAYGNQDFSLEIDMEYINEAGPHVGAMLVFILLEALLLIVVVVNFIRWRCAKGCNKTKESASKIENKTIAEPLLGGGGDTEETPGKASRF